MSKFFEEALNIANTINKDTLPLHLKVLSDILKDNIQFLTSRTDKMSLFDVMPYRDSLKKQIEYFVAQFQEKDDPNRRKFLQIYYLLSHPDIFKLVPNEIKK